MDIGTKMKWKSVVTPNCRRASSRVFIAVKLSPRPTGRIGYGSHTSCGKLPNWPDPARGPAPASLPDEVPPAEGPQRGQRGEGGEREHHPGGPRAEGRGGDEAPVLEGRDVEQPTRRAEQAAQQLPQERRGDQAVGDPAARARQHGEAQGGEAGE